MVLKAFVKKHENCIFTFALLLVTGIIIALGYDYYYDLNDDVLMKDILSGSYTGRPESHNIQMLYLISAFVCVFFRIAGSLPWYGLFLCGCQFLSLFLIVRRMLIFTDKWYGKLLYVLLAGVGIFGLLLEHMVYVQYTITATMLAASAVFLFYTTEQNLEPLPFIKKNIPAVLLVFIAFLIRSEMTLLVLPLIGVAGACRWGSEQKIFTRPNTLKYLGTFGGIVLALLIGQGTHMLAYSSDEWKTFTTFFDNRTELYDFQVIPTYAGNETFYDTIGLAESEQILLENYNFGLDVEIDEKLVGEVAAYAAQNRSADLPFMTNFKKSFANYVYRTSHGSQANGSDFPWNYMVIALYLCVAILAILAAEDRKYLKAAWHIGWKLLLLLAARTSLWMFILMRSRDPARIMHSLYFMEICILLAFLLEEGIARIRKPISGWIAGAVLGMVAIMGIPYTVSLADAQQTLRAEVNQPYEALYAYFKTPENESNFYWIDVYSSVARSEKMFVNVDNSLANYDIMGGWACKSPLYEKKLAAFGQDTMEKALLENEKVYFVAENTAELTWLSDYYKDHGTEIELSKIENVADYFTIYKVIEKP